LDNLGSFLRGTAVDEVVIALPMGSLHSDAAKIAALCEEQGITTRVLSSFDLKLARSTAEEFEGATIVTHYIGVDESWQLFMKRFFDVCISICVLLAFSPLLLIIAVLIKLTSPGPVLFNQYRVGLHKHQFRIYKFRTMVQDAERQMAKLEEFNEVSGPVFKIKNDPRTTPLGKILRRTSLDELPQLFNVLKGDMSLVGPRPLPVRDYQGFNEDWQRRRFSIRPGITCLWQIMGRSAIPFEQWMRLDLQYIDQWSLQLDMKILLRTIPAVLKGSGAA
jgi:exopolysaccharide biosynthesis polyprenyl glycosylphosphotransferase